MGNTMGWGIYHRRWHKFQYFLNHAHLGILPFDVLAWGKSLDNVLNEFFRLPENEQNRILARVNYYNQLNEPTTISGELKRIGQFKKKGFSAYYYDLADYLRYFGREKGRVFACEFGDVTHIPAQPTLVKSRPISRTEPLNPINNINNINNTNSILLKLDSVRHFYIYPDNHPNSSPKLDKVVWRGAGHQAHRLYFLERFWNNPNCDVACIHKKSLGKPYHGEFLSVEEQLNYQYILSIEGNDVATNLKWIMASQSVAMMITPKFETWAMEGLLKPDFHYIHLQDDYSDFDEKLNFYRKNPQSIQSIIQNAQQWINQFLNPKTELITNVMVLKKYFENTHE